MDNKHDILALLRGVAAGETSPEDALLRLKEEPFVDLGYAKGGPPPQRPPGGGGGHLRGGQDPGADCRHRRPPGGAGLPEHPGHPHQPGGGGGGQAIHPPGLPPGGPAGAGLPWGAEAAGPHCGGHRGHQRHPGGGGGGPHRRGHGQSGSSACTTWGWRGSTACSAAWTTLMSARCVIAVAGMEGAWPRWWGALVDCPVIAVPTSVGYGASFGGLSALLSMLNSCASGCSVVNIDNGFGAGYLASRINQMEGLEESR